MRGMRKRYRVLVLAAFAAALVVPVGYAVSLESTPVARARYTAATIVVPATLRDGGRLTPHIVYPVADAAKLLGVGTILLGLAAVLRKSRP